MSDMYYHFNANRIQKKFPGTEIKSIILYDDVCHSLRKDHVVILHRLAYMLHAVTSELAA